MDGVCSIPFSAHCSLDDSSRSAPEIRTQQPAPKGTSLRDFAAGPENAVVVEAVREVLYSSNVEYSPLVLHGPTGVGKTHLANGIAEMWRKRGSASNTKNTALVWNFVDFVRRHAEAIETQAIDEWNERLEQTTLLIIEDVDLPKAKEEHQEELVRILDWFASEQRQVIVTAKSSPKSLKRLSARLRSRLTSGLAVCVASPGVAARELIIQQLAEMFEIPLGPEAIESMAKRTAANYPQLRGMVLELRTSMRGEPLDEIVLEDVIRRRSTDKTPDLKTIASITAAQHGVKLTDLRSPSRRRQVVAARGVAMLLARELTGASYHQIGAYFGGRDHTTVLHGCRQTALRCEQDELSKAALDELRGELSRT